MGKGASVTTANKRVSRCLDFYLQDACTNRILKPVSAYLSVIEAIDRDITAAHDKLISLHI